MRDGRIATFEQGALAGFGPRCVGELGFGTGKIGLSAAQRGCLQRRIERRQARALLHKPAHLGAAGDEPAEGAETELRLIARLHAARERPHGQRGLRIDHGVKHRPHGRLLCGLPFAAARKNGRD